MQSNNKKKICIVASSLTSGGAERSSALLSIMLNNLGYSVNIVTVLSGIDYDYNGEIYNLGAINKYKIPFLNRLYKLKTFKRYLAKEKFDVIIDNRSRVQAYREFIITKFIYNSPTVYVIHNFETSKVFTPYQWLNRVLYKNKIMTAVSKPATQKFKKIYQLQRIETLYNGFDFDTINLKATENVEELPKKYIIFYGRLDDHHKNLKLLIDAYKLSQLPLENIKLLILGNGDDKEMIIDYVEDKKLTKLVEFTGFISNPYPYVKNAFFMVLTSRFEGFPMVIPETLSLGIPVVSVNCKSGPEEIITTGKNGILVENHNVNALSNAMDKLIFDTVYYNACKKETKTSVAKFSLENISKDWDKLLKKI